MSDLKLDKEQGLLATLTDAVLPISFYAQPTLTVAKELLGKTLLVVPEEGEPTAGIIVETEGYIAPEDPACHAYKGRSPRNEPMWGAPGNAYVYFTYGNHWMINVVTEEEGIAAASLIRAVEPILGLEAIRERRQLSHLKGNPADKMLTNGPGKLCQALGITGTYNRQPLQGPRLYICDTPSEFAPGLFKMVQTTRIGISAGKELPWRYYIQGNNYVSVR